jgi:hypothetical protein
MICTALRIGTESYVASWPLLCKTQYDLHVGWVEAQTATRGSLVQFRHGLLSAAIVCVLALAGYATTGYAQQQIISSKTPVLLLYAEPGSGKSVQQIKAAELAFPIPLLERVGDFGRIEAAGGTFWVDLRRTVFDVSVKSACTPSLAQNRKGSTAAASRGATNDCP